MGDITPTPPITPPAPKLPAATGPQSPDARAKAARQFEAVFAGQMTQLMMQSVESDGEFSGGAGEEVFRGVLADKMGDAIAQHGGLGLAPSVLQQIIKLQGGAP